MSSIIVALLPFWVGGFFLFTDPDFLQPMLDRTIGVGLLGGALVLELIGFLLTRRVMKIEV